MDSKVSEWLEKNGIEYILHTHPFVYTVEEARKYCSFIPGLHNKNLFIKAKKPNGYYLITIPADMNLNMVTLKAQINTKSIHFASEEDLFKYLGLKRGSVSPLGLINDNEKVVHYIIDIKVWNARVTNFHPNINNETIEITQKNFQKLVKATNNKFTILNLSNHK